MVNAEQRNPLIATSRRLGEMINYLLDERIRHVVVGLGGSACNDGGMGMLVALGVQFYDKSEQKLTGCGGDLASVDWSQLDSRIKDFELIIASDVTNPLVGPTGATYVFGPQKGLLPKMIDPIDRAMDHYAMLLEQEVRLKTDLSKINSPGSGAAGGPGFALQLLEGRVVPGAQVVADLTGLNNAIRQSATVECRHNRIKTFQRRHYFTRNSDRYKSGILVECNRLRLSS
ncbi:MAG: glycerate kinase [Paenibacillus sp.]|jgi:glycerate kinase|nr:glycerate kinase [Paenibacillus sp.]